MARAIRVGRALEHYVLMELVAHSSYEELDYEIRFWRTKSGLEVDFVLGDGEVAIEVKGSNRVDNRVHRPLRAFIEEYQPRRALVVCNEIEERRVGPIRILPHRAFFRELWNGGIIA